jgi:hypothetical protein
LLSKADVASGNEALIIQYLVKFYWTFNSKNYEEGAGRRMESIMIEEPGARRPMGGKINNISSQIKINPMAMMPGQQRPNPASQQSQATSTEPTAPSEIKLTHLTKQRGKIL